MVALLDRKARKMFICILPTCTNGTHPLIKIVVYVMCLLILKALSTLCNNPAFCNTFFTLKYTLMIYNLPHHLAQTIGTASMAALFEQHWMVEHLAAHGAFIGLIQRLQKVILGILVITGKRHTPNKECDYTTLYVHITHWLGMCMVIILSTHVYVLSHFTTHIVHFLISNQKNKRKSNFLIRSTLLY